MTDLKAAQQKLERWLLSADVVHADGAVVSWLDGNGQWDGLYPEIAGYHLHFCALLSEAIEARNHAARITAWLDRIAPDGDPPTILPAAPAADDWRNRGLFAFDLAIILRGLESADARFPGTIPKALVARIASQIVGLAEDGILRSHSVREPGAMPEKWSTRRGGHHVKAAAALLSSPDTLLTDIAEDTAEARWDQFEAERQQCFGLHPLLYFVEGWLIFWGRTEDPVYLERARAGFDRALELRDLADAGSERGDVIAQMLRAGTLLDKAGTAPPEWRALAPYYIEALFQRIGEDGALRFNAEGHRNCWAGLFAWQALDTLIRADDVAFALPAFAAALI